jgi:hypothetical protein
MCNRGVRWAACRWRGVRGGRGARVRQLRREQHAAVAPRRDRPLPVQRVRPVHAHQRREPAARPARQAAGESATTLVTRALCTGAEADLLTRFYKDGSVHRWMSVEGMARGMKKVSRWRVD